MISILLLSAVVALGIVFRVGVPEHVSLHRRTLLQFLSVFDRGLTWPHVNHALLVLVMQLPLF